MAMAALSLKGTGIGATVWRETTRNDLQMNRKLVENSDIHNERGRTLDPLPNFMETVVSHGNKDALRYMRQVRVVVAKLHQTWRELNDEIRTMNRVRASYERMLDHTRKDLVINRESSFVRDTRAQREKVHDSADDMIFAERVHLTNVKKSMEDHLKRVQERITELDEAREFVNICIKERSQVLELINGSLFAVRSGRVDASGKRSSSPAPPATPSAAPLSAMTIEAERAIQFAAEVRQRSMQERKPAKSNLAEAEKLVSAARRAVNDGLAGKVAETVKLNEQLTYGIAENRHAINRAQRWYDTSERAFGAAEGPESTYLLQTREKLERPILRTFQKHPGNQLPEAQLMIQARDNLRRSLDNTVRSVESMWLTQQSLIENAREKSGAADADSSAVRLRRRKANHRWVVSAPQLARVDTL